MAFLAKLIFQQTLFKQHEQTNISLICVMFWQSNNEDHMRVVFIEMGKCLLSLHLSRRRLKLVCHPVHPSVDEMCWYLLSATHPTVLFKSF